MAVLGMPAEKLKCETQAAHHLDLGLPPHDDPRLQSYRCYFVEMADSEMFSPCGAFVLLVELDALHGHDALRLEAAALEDLPVRALTNGLLLRLLVLRPERDLGCFFPSHTLRQGGSV